MTTMELIERGIGHNCLSDAYDLGRADEREEWETAAGEMIMKYAGDIYKALPNVVKEIQTKAYQQGRVDAIKEVIALIEHGYTERNLYDYLKSKQLKEQK